MRWLYWIIWRVLYPGAYRLVFVLINLLPRTHPWHIWKIARKNLVHEDFTTDPSVLFFCPSLGEYQAITPLIREHRVNSPELKIEVVFFSLSGYQSLPQMTHDVDSISLSPYDLMTDCTAFFQARQVRHVIISTLAIWPVFLRYLDDHDIPFTFVNVDYKKGLWHKVYYTSLSPLLLRALSIYCLNQKVVSTWRGILSSDNILIGGDGRLEMIDKQLSERSGVKSSNNSKIIFASIEPSEWPILELLTPLLERKAEITIVPHDIIHAMSIVRKIQSLYPDHLEKIEVVDRMGLLISLYPKHDIAYVGGGFDKGIHNIAEPILAGCQVIIGPNYTSDPYAAVLKELDGISIASNLQVIIERITYLTHHPRKTDTTSVQNYLRSNKGSASDIYQDLKELYQ